MDELQLCYKCGTHANLSLKKRFKTRPDLYICKDCRNTDALKYRTSMSKSTGGTPTKMLGEEYFKQAQESQDRISRRFKK